MKKLVTAYLLMITACASAQKEPLYIPGLIVTITDDTIYCRVPLVQNFGIAVITKDSTNKHFDTIPISRIKYLANGRRVYETVSFNTADGMKQELMWLKREGTINLYELAYYDDVYRNTRQISSGTEMVVGQPMTVTRFQSTTDPPTIIRVIRKNNQNYLLSDKYFRQVVGPLVADNPAVTEKVNSKKYKLDSIDFLVAEYNGD